MRYLVFRSMREAEGFHKGIYKQEDSEAVYLEAPVFLGSASFHILGFTTLHGRVFFFLL